LQRVLLGLAAVFFPRLAFGADPAAQVVSLSTHPAVALEQGQSCMSSLSFLVAEGFHIQSNPASEDYLIPARLKISSAKGVVPGEPVYPQGSPYRLEGSEKSISTYGGSFAIQVPVEVFSSEKPGRRVLKGSLRYQACDTKRCLFPAEIPVSLPVEVIHGKRKWWRSLKPGQKPPPCPEK
jgi:hypothetical protein